MKPVRFDYQRPKDLDDAVRLAGEESGVVKLIAGGQSLGPMLNMRLVQPDLIVDVAGVEALRRVEDKGDAIEVGACVTHADFEDLRVPDVANGALAAVARGIAYRAVRTRGTIGGSLVHADPSADWIAALAAVGAAVILKSRNGLREVAVGDFMLGALSADLRSGEVLEAVRIPKLGPDARFGYVKFCRKTGEFAHAIGVFLDDPDRGVRRAVIGATESRPIVIEDANGLFGGEKAFSSKAFDLVAANRAMVAAGLSDPIDRQLHAVALGRAVAQAEAG